MAQPILTVEEFKELQKMKRNELNTTELFFAYQKYFQILTKINKIKY